MSTNEFETIRQAIHLILKSEELTVNSVIKKTKFKESKVIEVVRFMLDNDQIIENKSMKLKLK